MRKRSRRWGAFLLCWLMAFEASASRRQTGFSWPIVRNGFCFLVAATPQNTDFRESTAQRDYSQAPDLSPPKPLNIWEAFGWGLLVPVTGFAVIRFLAKKKSSRPGAKAEIVGGSQGQAEEGAVGQRVAADANSSESVAPVGLKAMSRDRAVTFLERERDHFSKDAEGAAGRTDALEDFLASVPDQIAALRNLFAEISRSQNDAARQKILSDLCAQIGSFRSRLAAFELRPAWRMASALETLLDQIAARPSNLTPSSLRTAAGAIVLLEKLCQPGSKADLAPEAPPRFLAVDDDPISRHAVCAALKKTFSQPDVAEGGPAALELAASKPYDVVFLDVEMPGMDGFEVCSRIHQTGDNSRTPVVFVTSHSDFESRARSSQVGGHDLVGKPFLPSEIALKALVLMTRSRLERGPAEQYSSNTSTQRRTDKGRTAQPASVPPAPPTGQVPEGKAVAEKEIVIGSQGGLPAKEVTGPFGSHAVEVVFKLRNLLLRARSAPQTSTVKEILGEFFVGIHSLSGDAERAERKAVFHLSWGIEKLIRKTLEQQECSPASALESAASALDAIDELCRRQAEWDFKNPPLQILVVDDDPVARRAMSNALQLGFGRPDCADDGEAAILLAREKPYDVIFMDGLMPGMDGFAACSRIREAGPSSTTPIVFVSSLTDGESREKSSRCGGNGFISKPAPPAEIALTALTFAAVRRLQTAVDSESGELPKGASEPLAATLTDLPL